MDFRNSAHTLEGGNEGRKERKAKKTMQRRHCESWIPSINLQIHFLPFSSSACLLNGYCACTEQHSEKTRMCMESKSSLHPISNLPSPQTSITLTFYPPTVVNAVQAYPHTIDICLAQTMTILAWSLS